MVKSYLFALRVSLLLLWCRGVDARQVICLYAANPKTQQNITIVKKIWSYSNLWVLGNILLKIWNICEVLKIPRDLWRLWLVRKSVSLPKIQQRVFCWRRQNTKLIRRHAPGISVDLKGDGLWDFRIALSPPLKTISKWPQDVAKCLNFCLSPGISFM